MTVRPSASNSVNIIERCGSKFCKNRSEKNDMNDCADGSIIIVIATDAPIDWRNLNRMAARSMMGLARTGAAGTNGSGDYAIAFSTAPEVRIKNQAIPTRETSNFYKMMRCRLCF